MSALGDLINAAPGLIAHLPLDDTAAATLPAIQGPNSGSLTASYNASADGGATAIIAGDAFATTIPAAGYVDVAAHAVLRPSGDFTHEVFAVIGANPSATAQVIGVGTAYDAGLNGQVYIATNGRFGVRAYDSGNTASQFADWLNSPTGLVHVAVIRRGPELFCLVNGGLRRAVAGWMANPTRQTASPWRVGSSTGGLAMTVAHAAIYDRALTLGEVRNRLDLAGISRSTVDIGTDLTSKRRSRTVARGATVYDAGTGNQLSSLEAHITDSTGVRWDPVSFHAIRPGLATTPPTSSITQSEAGTWASRIIMQQVNVWGLRQTSSDGNYYDTSGQWINGLSYPGEWQNGLGMVYALATLHRLGGGRRYGWAYDMAVRSMETALLVQEASGRMGTSGTMHQFLLNQMFTIYRLLEPSLDSPRRTRWLAAMLDAVEYELTGEGNWYTNGNIELKAAAIFAYAYEVTGDPQWQDAMEDQITFTESPPPGVSGSPSDYPTSSFGWVTTVARTANDGSDGAGYFKESNGTTAGLDWNYCLYQATIAGSAYAHTGDIRFLRYANMCWNTVEGMGQGGSSRLAKNTTSQWILDGTGGVRVNSATLTGSSPVPAILAYRGGRSGLAADASAVMRSYYYLVDVNPNGNGAVYRLHGEGLAEVLMASRSFAL